MKIHEFLVSLASALYIAKACTDWHTRKNYQPKRVTVSSANDIGYDLAQKIQEAMRFRSKYDLD